VELARFKAGEAAATGVRNIQVIAHSTVSRPVAGEAARAGILPFEQQPQEPVAQVILEREVRTYDERRIAIGIGVVEDTIRTANRPIGLQHMRPDPTANGSRGRRLTGDGEGPGCAVAVEALAGIADRSIVV